MPIDFGLAILGQNTARLIPRAWDWFIHEGLGTSTIGLCIVLVVYFMVGVLRRYAHTTNRQWWLAMKDQWNQSGKFHFYGTIVIYTLLFFVSIIVVSHQKPILSSQQIADYANGIVTGLGDDRYVIGSGKYPNVIGTGFWVSTNGYMLTCLDPSHLPEQSKVNVLVLISPPSNSKMMTMATAFEVTPGFPWCYESATGMELIWVSNNPFQRTNHILVGFKNLKTGDVEGPVDQYKVPEISKEDVQAGETIYLVCVSSDGVERNISTIEGRVERIGTDTSTIYHSRRIHTSIPYSPTYRGSPVLNVAGEVVGVVADSQTKCVVIPSSYILELLSQSRMQTIKSEAPKLSGYTIRPIDQYLNASNSIEDTTKATSTFDMGSPGFTYLALLRLEKPVLGRNNFLLDVGRGPESNRISIYVDSSEKLCFRVIDQESQSLELKVHSGLETFIFGSVCYLICEYGMTNTFSFVRMLINGREVAQQQRPSLMFLPDPLGQGRFVMGSDLNHQNGGVFDLGEFACYATAIRDSDVVSLLPYMNQKAFNTKYVSFSGSQWLDRNPSTRALENSQTNRQSWPTLKIIQ